MKNILLSVSFASLWVSDNIFIVQCCVIVFGEFVPNAGVELDDVIFAIASDVGRHWKSLVDLLGMDARRDVQRIQHECSKAQEGSSSMNQVICLSLKVYLLCCFPASIKEGRCQDIEKFPSRHFCRRCSRRGSSHVDDCSMSRSRWQLLYVSVFVV